ncbi:MAG: hypothetical protein ABIO70_10590 [Pseudomonadota bacterium]
MAGKTNETALQKATRGEKLTDRQAQSALGQALKRLSSVGKQSDKIKDAVVVTGGMVVHSAETQGTLFLASMAEGYFGKAKLELGGVDVRAPVAIVTQGFGIYEAMTGKKGGNHALAIGNGLMGSWLASVGVSAGKTLREKRNAPAQPEQTQQQAPAATMTPALQGNAEILALPAPSLIPEPAVRGREREILLTPAAREAESEEEEDFEGRRRGRRGPPRRGRGRGGPGGQRRGGRRERPSRFVRAERDDDSELDEFDE